MKKQNVMLKRLSTQRGASFLGWMIVAAAVVFVLVTAVKIVPAYMEFATVKSMVDGIVADETLGKINNRVLRTKLENHLKINSLYNIKPESFSVVKMAENNNALALQVAYEVRKPWLSNIDFMMDFYHLAEFKRQN